MTMSVLLGLGGVAQRSGERGGKAATDTAADGFGELVGNGGKKKPAADRLGLEDNPHDERLGTGRKLLGMYDLRLHQLGDGTAMLRSIEAAAEQTLDIDPPRAATEPEEFDPEAVEGDPAAAQVVVPVRLKETRAQTKSAVDPVQAGTEADAEQVAGDVQPEVIESPIVASEPVPDDTAPPATTDDADLHSRVAVNGAVAPGSERNQRTSRTAASPAPQQNGPAVPASARAETAPAGEPSADDSAPPQRQQAAAPGQAVSDIAQQGVDRNQSAPQHARRVPAGATGPASGNPPANDATDPFGGRVKVVGSSAPTTPPPALVSLIGPTSASVVAAIEADPTWRAAATEMASSTIVRTPNSTQGVNTLRIQLNPAELGMVTARLTATGSQLSIEIQVESNDARQRLANDSEAIVKALRSVGLEVDRITIQQSAGSPSGNGQPATGGRDQQFTGQQAQSDGSGRERGDGRQTGGQNRDDARAGMAERAGGRSDGDLYI